MRGVKNYKSRSVKSGDFLFYLFQLAALLAFLRSFHAWFTWYYFSPSMISVICAALSIPLILLKTEYFHWSINKLFIILLLVGARFYSAADNNVSLLVLFQTFLSLLPIIFFILLERPRQLIFLKFFTKSMAIILTPSLIVWCFLLIGIPLPKVGVISHEAWDQYVYENYILCLRNLMKYEFRFCSIFLEPGHLGIICSFLLFINKFKVRKPELLAIFIAAIFTLSLAAYVLLAISFSMYVIIYSKRRLQYIVMWLSFLSVGYFFGITYNNGKNIVNELIILRLAYDEEEGVAGNNRFTQTMDLYYSDFVKTDKLYFGIGDQKFQSYDFGANAGYKVFIVRHGLIGLLLVLLFYITMFWKYRSPFGAGLLILFALSFLQRAYPFWDALLYIYILGLVINIDRRTHLFNRKVLSNYEVVRITR